MDPIRNETDFDRLFDASRLMAVVDAWVERGLFADLAEGGAKRLEDLEGDERALRITARMLANRGLLVRRGDLWALSSAGEGLYESGVLGEEGAFSIYRKLPQLSEVIAEGGPVVDEEGRPQATTIGVTPEDPERTRSFLHMLHRRCEVSARATAEWIDEVASASAHILDLGGGHGRYGRELVELGHRATLFDLPVCVEVARDLNGEALDYLEGDFFEDDLGGPYDVVLASNIVHGLSERENLRLMRRIADVLAPQGMVVLKDMFLDEFGLWPPTAVHFGLLMLMYTDGGDSYSLERVNQWFEKVGLVPRKPMVFEGYALVSATKQD